MNPARSPFGGNKYIDVVVDGLTALGIEVEGLPRVPGAYGADVVHLHWLEQTFAAGRLSKIKGLHRLRAAAILAIIERVKRRGGRLVWTVHNLRPHRSLDYETENAYQLFQSEVLAQLDVFISLSKAGTAIAREAYPQLRDVPFVVSRHPHYRGVVKRSAKRAPLRSAIGVADDHYVLGSIGRVFPHKGVVGAAENFLQVPGRNLRFVVAGPFEAESRSALRLLSEKDARLILVEADLSDEQIADWHAAVDAVIFNGAQNFNSGTLLMGLSLDRPLIAPLSATNEEMASLVGNAWVSLFRAPLTPSGLDHAIRLSRHSSRDVECPLGAFDPMLSATELSRAYSGSL